MQLTPEEQKDWNNKNVEKLSLQEIQEGLNSFKDPKGDNVSNEFAIHLYAGADGADKSFKIKKYISLFRARTVLSIAGNMKERQLARFQLKRMKELGLKSL